MRWSKKKEGEQVICHKCGTLMVFDHCPACEPFWNQAKQLEGTTFADKYRISHQIHRSADSAVFTAVELETKRDVVIKLFTREEFRTDLSYPRRLERFLRQIEQHNRLDHPNIVQCIAHGKTESTNIHYIVFERVPCAFSLEMLPGRFAFLPPSCFLEVFINVCDALEHAHERGIFHDDLSPDDVIIGMREEDGIWVKLTDFSKGMALLHSDNQRMQQTELGDLFGHPGFMAPESCLGEPIDARANIYSLGCIMYRAMMNEDPFSGAHWGAVMLNKLREDAPLLHLPGNEFAASLQPIIARCMERDPAKRFSSMAKLKESLEQLRTEHQQPVSYTEIRVRLVPRRGYVLAEKK